MCVLLYYYVVFMLKSPVNPLLNIKLHFDVNSFMRDPCVH